MQNERGDVTAALRLCGLFALLCIVWVHGRLFCRGTLLQRGQWRQRWCIRIVRYLGLQSAVSGVVPQRGLMVANHISYLDVLVLGALTPAAFVAKKEVRRWPVIGACCAMGGTLYLDRESPRAVAAINRRIADAFAQNVPVVVFPEGTTTAGDQLLPLHTALFQAAVQRCVPIIPTALTYHHAGGALTIRERIAYWGDMTLLPHLHSLMKLRGITADVRFRATSVPARTRAEAAMLCEMELRRMLGSTTDLREDAALPVAQQMSAA